MRRHAFMAILVWTTVVAGLFVWAHFAGNPLPEAEAEYAQSIFRDSVDLEQVTIVKDHPFSYWSGLTLGNSVFLSTRHGHFDQSGNISTQGRIALIHELGHVWQYQTRGFGYIPNSASAQYRAWRETGSRSAAYNWESAHKADRPWALWNAEQQAELIEDYALMLRASASTSSTLPYMEYVWQGVGAP